ncbi:MAG: hypothetical protein KGI50_03675 [Patescibacteria group bacterium]|nr:hypothetical protein [Patescibacteria group bacterium]MDE2438390.1 hypothetical protein [Patescibacteria group bacterium]
MCRKLTDIVHAKRRRAARDVRESYPAVVLNLGGSILMLACSDDYRQRIKRVLDRIFVISFGSDGFELQRAASAIAKGEALEVSYENVHALGVGEKIGSLLASHLKDPKRPEIDAAMVFVRITGDPSTDEVVVVPHTGISIPASGFISGPLVRTETKAPSRSRKTEKASTPRESLWIGAQLESFEEYLHTLSRVNSIELMLRFGAACAKKYGNEIYLEIVQLDRDAVLEKRYAEVAARTHGPWHMLRAGLKETLAEIVRQQEEEKKTARKLKRQKKKEKQAAADDTQKQDALELEERD